MPFYKKIRYKSVNKQGGWKPKNKWLKAFTIDLKTGKSEEEYYTPKSQEEEDIIQKDFDFRMEKVYDIIFKAMADNKKQK